MKLLDRVLNAIYPPEPAAPEQLNIESTPAEPVKIKEDKTMSATILDIKKKIAIAKQHQAANHANTPLSQFAGQHIIVSGMHISEKVEIKSAGLIMDKVTLTLQDGTAVDAWYLAAVENCRSLIEDLGEGPYEPMYVMEVKEQLTHEGTKSEKTVYYPDLIDIYDPDGKYAQMAAEAELDAKLGLTPEPAPIPQPSTVNTEPANTTPAAPVQAAPAAPVQA